MFHYLLGLVHCYMIFLAQFEQLNKSFVDNTIAAENAIYKVHCFFSLVVEFVVLTCGAHL